MFRNILQLLPNTIKKLAIAVFLCGKTWSVTDTPKKKTLGPCAFHQGCFIRSWGQNWKVFQATRKKQLNFLDFLLFFLLQGHLNHQAGVFFSGKTSFRFRSLQICPSYHSHPFSSWCITMWKSRLESLVLTCVCFPSVPRRDGKNANIASISNQIEKQCPIKPQENMWCIPDHVCMVY